MGQAHVRLAAERNRIKDSAISSPRAKQPGGAYERKFRSGEQDWAARSRPSVYMHSPTGGAVSGARRGTRLETKKRSLIHLDNFSALWFCPGRRSLTVVPPPFAKLRQNCDVSPKPASSGSQNSTYRNHVSQRSSTEAKGFGNKSVTNQNSPTILSSAIP